MTIFWRNDEGKIVRATSEMPDPLPAHLEGCTPFDDREPNVKERRRVRNREALVAWQRQQGLPDAPIITRWSEEEQHVVLVLWPDPDNIPTQAQLRNMESSYRKPRPAKEIETDILKKMVRKMNDPNYDLVWEGDEDEYVRGKLSNDGRD